MHLREKLSEISKDKTNLTNYLIAKNILIFLDRKNIPTVDQIAKMSYTNKSTITRFAQKLKFKGWKDFINELYQDEEKYYPKIEKKQIALSDNFKIFQEEIISNILVLNQYQDQIKKIVKTMKKKNIYLFNSYQNEDITQNFYENLQMLNLNVKWIPGVNKIQLSPIVKENAICFWIISGIDNAWLVNIYNDVKTLKTTNIVLGTTSQISKLKNSDYCFQIHVGGTLMRENTKKILLTYFLNQFINLLINQNEDLLSLIINPKFKY